MSKHLALQTFGKTLGDAYFLMDAVFADLPEMKPFYEKRPPCPDFENVVKLLELTPNASLEGENLEAARKYLAKSSVVSEPVEEEPESMSVEASQASQQIRYRNPN